MNFSDFFVLWDQIVLFKILSGDFGSEFMLELW